MQAEPRYEQLLRATPRMVRDINRLLKQLSAKSPPVTLPLLESILLQQNLFLLGAFDERGKLLGMASIYFEDLLARKTAWIEDVVVDMSARGKGIGKALVIKLLELAQIRGASEINLTSRPERKEANLLYEKLGFVKRETNVYRFTPKPLVQTR